MFLRAGMPLDVVNTVLPEHDESLRKIFAPFWNEPQRASFAVAAVVRILAAATSPEYILACHEPRSRFVTRTLAQTGQPSVSAPVVQIPQDPVTWLAEFRPQTNHGPIGLLFLGAGTPLSDLADVLDAGRQHMADTSWIVIEGSNASGVRAAANEFLAGTSAEARYKVILDAETTGIAHPTWGDGLLVLQRGSELGCGR